MENNKCPFCLHSLPEGPETCSCGARRKAAWRIKMEDPEERKVAAIALAFAAFSIMSAAMIFGGALGEFNPAKVFMMLCLGFASTFTATYFFFYDYVKLRKERVWLPAKGGAQ